MECVACTRSDTTRCYYCSNCIKSRLIDHQQRKQQLRNQLTLQSNRANSLLHNPSSSTSSLGIRHESQSKADRWTLSLRLRDTRIAIEQEKQSTQFLTTSIEQRRLSLSSRRSNLSTARSLLTSLSSSQPSSLPNSLSSLTTSLSSLSSSHSALSSSLLKVRRILTLELLTVFQFRTLESPLPDPFILQPHPTFLPTYTISTLPLPNLSLLQTLTPQKIEALLASLAHLTRLIALYEGVSLPFPPSLSGFGPGRAGVKASPGSGLSRSVEEGEGLIESWPLVFGSERGRKGSSRNGKGEDQAEVEDGRREHEESNRKNEVSVKRFKMVMTGAIAIAFDLAYISWVRDSRKEDGDEEGTGARRNWRIDDLDDLGRLILTAAGAEKGGFESNREEENDLNSFTPIASSTPEDIDPFPSLTSPPSSPPSSSAATILAPPPLLTPPTFPLSFPLVVEHYLSLSFPPPKKRSKKKGMETIGRGDRLGQSSFVDAGVTRSRGHIGSREGLGEGEEEDEEEEEEEEWDFV